MGLILSKFAGYLRVMCMMTHENFIEIISVVLEEKHYIFEDYRIQTSSLIFLKNGILKFKNSNYHIISVNFQPIEIFL